ncbi:unnamed protein product [Boreogadus saida]
MSPAAPQPQAARLRATRPRSTAGLLSLRSGCRGAPSLIFNVENTYIWFSILSHLFARHLAIFSQGQAIPIPCQYISGQALSIPICEDIPSFEDLPGQAGSYF